MDLVHFGQLYENKCLWDGHKILPEKWIKESFTARINITGKANEFYNYLFWNKSYPVGGKDYKTYCCSGNGGNKIFMFKDIPVVVVITAKAYIKRYGHPQADTIIEEYILPAITPAHGTYITLNLLLGHEVALTLTLPCIGMWPSIRST